MDCEHQSEGKKGNNGEMGGDKLGNRQQAPTNFIEIKSGRNPGKHWIPGQARNDKLGDVGEGGR
jgi:hypothetical protein